MPRIATSGQLTIGVNAVPPMPPRFEIDIDPPDISSSVSLRALAFSASCWISTESSIRFFWSALRITGTSRPFSVSTAMPTLMYFL